MGLTEALWMLNSGCGWEDCFAVRPPRLDCFAVSFSGARLLPPIVGSKHPVPSEMGA